MHRPRSAALSAVVVVSVLTGCSGGASSGSSASASPTGLAAYTDAGDGCAQAVSAIAYADDLLRPLGQEAYQEWDDAVRSRLAAVAGTIALEVEDFPDDEILQAASVVHDRADSVGAAGARRAERVRLLREYRRDATSLVLLCAPHVDPTPSAEPDARSR